VVANGGGEGVCPAHSALLDLADGREHLVLGDGEGIGAGEDAQGIHALESGGGHPIVDDTIDEV
jgi:hypothetical protein